MFKEIFDPRNYYWNPWAAPVLFVSILLTLMGFFVWSKNKKSPVNISYILVSLSCCIWLFPTVWMFASNDLRLALFWNSIIWVGIPLISPSVYFYSVA